jgi:hypothetical protein
VVLRTYIGGAGSIKPLTLVVSSQANYSRHSQDGHLTSTQDDFVLLSHQQDKHTVFVTLSYIILYGCTFLITLRT